jgi:L-iditol 2-dehydrogenase
MRVAAGAMCGTDVHIVHGTMATRPPLILGHELAGVVASLGPGVEGWGVGERVTTETDLSFCGRCPFCLVGDMHLCAERVAIGTTADGGFAELVALPASGLHRLPEGVSFAAGALSEPLAVAIHAVIERARVAAGEHVAVIGPGTIGLLVAQVALAQGAHVSVIGLARHAKRFELARAVGVRRTAALDVPGDLDAVRAGGDGLGLDQVFDCSGTEDGVDAGLRLLRKGGRLVEVAFFTTPRVPLDLATLVQRELTVMASRGKRPTCFRIAMDLLRYRRVQLEPLITHRFPLASWREALAAAELPGSKVLLEIAAP